MSYKPGDFFIGVIDFLGILLPGVVLVYMHGEFFLSFINIQSLTGIELDGVFFFVASYIIGHFLLGIGVPLNRLGDFLLKEEKDEYYQEVKDSDMFASKKQHSRTDIYYRAYSFVRIHSAAAISEVDRQAAEYKLFRSLTLVFLIDIPFAWISNEFSLLRMIVAFVFAGLALWRFVFLQNWAQRLTFEYYYLLTKGSRPINGEQST